MSSKKDRAPTAGQEQPRRFTILGAARSGLAAARYLRGEGMEVFISDTCPAEDLDFVLASNDLAQVPHEAGEHTDRALECDCIVVSPGVPSNLPILKVARSHGIPVWSEMELGFRRSKAEFCAVTGSVGKSTTVSMVGEIARAAGRESVVAGNIGLPVISAAPALSAKGLVVAEVSSYQLENIDTFKPRAAAVTNLLKNHLDRYRHEEEYYEAKKAITRNMDKQCTLVLNGTDRRLRQWADEMGGKINVVVYGARDEHLPCVYCEGGAIVSGLGGKPRKVVEIAALKVSGMHNAENAAAATALARAVDIGFDAIADGLRAFEGLPHRLQLVGEYDGVKYYNDSKSTTAESILTAISAFEGNVHLIAGGRDKGCEFAVVNEMLETHVKNVFLIGEAAQRMQAVWRRHARVVREKSLEAAVADARGHAAAGDVVLFSPGCSSFDMFRDYEQRGEAFVALVRGVRAPERAEG